MPMREPLLPTRSRERIGAENREELAGWIEERTADLVATGLERNEAHRRALEEFGDIAGAGEYANHQDIVADRRARLLLWMEEFAADLRIAARTLARTPTVTAIVLLTFALGIGAATSVFSVVHAMLLRPLLYGSEESLFYLPATDNGVVTPGLGGGRHSAAALVALRERTTSFAGIAGASQGNYVLSGAGDPEQIPGVDMTANGFEVLQVRPAIGRHFNATEESRDVVVLLDELWRRRFAADSTIIGRMIELSGDRYQVIGIMPRGFRIPTYEQAELITPRPLAGLLANPTNAHVRFLRLFGRVRPGVPIGTAQLDVARVMAVLRAELPRSYSDIDARVLPIRSAIAGEAKPRVLILMGAACFVLLIACANVAGILLSRAIARRHELSVRVALGAGRYRLVRQFMAEGVVISALGAGLGLVMAQLGVTALRHNATTSLPAGTTFTLEPMVVAFAVGAAVVTALASALVPAFGATRSLGVALRRDGNRSSASRSSRQLRHALVAGQLAISIVLLVGAGLLLRTLNRLTSLDLGFDTDHALTFRVQFSRAHSNAEQDAFWAAMYEQLRALPGVRTVGGGNVPMSGLGTVVGLAIEGRQVPSGRAPDVRYTPASDDYFAALGIPVLEGRTFNAADRDNAPRVAVLSAGLAHQLWPGGDAVGARVKPGPDQPWVVVVGIVGDVRMGSADAPLPTIYTSQRQDHWPGGGAIVVRTTADPGSIVAMVRQVVKNIDPGLPLIGLRTMEEFRRSTPAIADRQLQMQLMLAFAVIALAVSAIGVYGVTAYAAAARRREFGIRLALGASRRRVLWLAIRDGGIVAMLGRRHRRDAWGVVRRAVGGITRVADA
jgi:putative ABC transport system permease protein